MQRMRNNDECMLGGVMEEKRGMVRAVPLAGGRSPGRVRLSARVLVPLPTPAPWPAIAPGL